MDSLHSLLQRIEQADELPYRTSLSEVESMFKRSEHWVAVAGYPADDGAADAPLQDPCPKCKEMVAFGYVGLARDGTSEAVCQGGVSPAARRLGIGSKLLEWQTRAGAKLLQTESRAGEGVLTHTVPDGDDDFREGLEAFGYRWVGSAVELRADVDSWQRPAERPAYVELMTWTEDLDDLARRAFNKVNAELGNPRVSKSDWAQMNAGISRNWSYVAMDQGGDRPRVVGLVSTGGFEQDWQALGWTEGVLQIVAVLDPDRREETLSALLDATVTSLHRDGIQKVSVTLDPNAEESTVDFYRRQGFAVSSWYHTYSMPVPKGSKVPLFD